MLTTTITTTTILAFLADKILGSILGKISGDLYEKVKGEPAKKAFKRALGKAIQRYAKENSKVALTRSLLNRQGVLADKFVANELMQLVRFEQEPNFDVVGNKWKAFLPELDGNWNFAQEARLFFSYFEEELRSTEAYRPVFEAKDLHAIRDALIPNQEVEDIEAKIDGLNALLETKFSQLLEAFSRLTEDLGSNILDQSGFIEEKTRGFVGRHWVYEKVDTFIQTNPRGYFFIKGDPGIGKSSIAANYVRIHGCPYHFTIRAEQIDKPATFLNSICAQLIATYSLNYLSLPANCGDNSGFLDKVLREVSRKCIAGERCVIFVDALDEASETPGNLLCLPITLPEKVYIIVTMRNDRKFMPRIDCEQGELFIGNNSSENLSDVSDYLQSVTGQHGIQDYMNQQGIQKSEFVQKMVSQSEGNFMYLHYVLREIEKGAYHNTQIDHIPQGLEGYYRDHWKRMRGMDEEAWFKYKLPVILALTVARSPISLDLISKYSDVTDRNRIRAVLLDWSQFLHFEDIEEDGQTKKHYRLYHASFFDFVSHLQEVAEERVDLKVANAKIANIYWDILKEW
jgi:hypothetical protein